MLNLVPATFHNLSGRVTDLQKLFLNVIITAVYSLRNSRNTRYTVSLDYW